MEVSENLDVKHVYRQRLVSGSREKKKIRGVGIERKGHVKCNFYIEPNKSRFLGEY
jgi:hypothetical protein